MTCEDGSSSSSSSSSGDGDHGSRRSGIQSAPQSANASLLFPTRSPTMTIGGTSSTVFTGTSKMMLQQQQRRKSQSKKNTFLTRHPSFQEMGFLPKHRPIGSNDCGDNMISSKRRRRKNYVSQRHSDEDAQPHPSARPPHVKMTGGIFRRRTWNDGMDMYGSSSSDDEDEMNTVFSVHLDADLALFRRNSGSKVSVLGRAAKLSNRYALVSLIVAILAVHQLVSLPALGNWRNARLDHGDGNTSIISSSTTGSVSSIRGARESSTETRNSHERKRNLDIGVMPVIANDLASMSSTSSSSQHRLVGIVRDALAIERNILDFLVNMACHHRVSSHVLTSTGASDATTIVRDLIEKKFGSSQECAEIVFASEPPQLFVGLDNRVDRIAKLRDYQRDMLMTDRRQHASANGRSGSPGDDVVIVADLDLHSLPSVEEVMQEVQRTTHPNDEGADIICAAGIMHRPIGYYDTFATVLLPNTFVYPVSGRFDGTMHNDEDQQFVISDSFTQEDLLHHFERSSQDEYNDRPVPVRSCFGGLAIYKADVWYEPQCRYFSWESQCSPETVRYANVEDGRSCEHVSFAECLRDKRPDLAIAVQPSLRPKWDSAAQSLLSSLRSGEHLLTVHSDLESSSTSTGAGVVTVGTGAPETKENTTSGQLDHDHLSSSNGNYRLRIHPATGNVLLEQLKSENEKSKVVWSALEISGSTARSTSAAPTRWMDMQNAIQSIFTLRDDGRLVLEREVQNTANVADQVCNPSDKTCRFEVWSSELPLTRSSSDDFVKASLLLSDEGALSVQDEESNEILWSSATNVMTWPECPSFIPSGFQIHAGDILCSPSGAYRLGIDSIGIFIRRAEVGSNKKAYIPLEGRVGFDSASDSTASLAAHIQGDGNFVVYRPAGGGGTDSDRDLVWASNTAFPGAQGSRVELHDDGVRIVSSQGVVLKELIAESSSACRMVLPSGGRLEAGQHICSQKPSTGTASLPLYEFGLSSHGAPQLRLLASTSSFQEPEVIWVAPNVTSSQDDSSHLVLQDDGNLVLYDKDSIAVWSTDTTAPGAVVSFSQDGRLQIISPDGTIVASISANGIERPTSFASRNILESNESLLPGEKICSPSGNFCFGVVDSIASRLCLWKVDEASIEESTSSTEADCIWSTDLLGFEGSSPSLTMQGDGNLVLIVSAGDDGSDMVTLWSSESHGSTNEDSFLVIRDYGAAEVVNKQGITTFSIAGNGICPRWLLGGQSLRNDQEFLCSPDSHFRLGLGSDSNVAIWDLRSQDIVWQTKTCCDDVVVHLQMDANFIVSGTFDDVWSSEATTNSTNGVALTLSNAGHAEIFDQDGSLVWSSANDDSGDANTARRSLPAVSPLPGCDAIAFRSAEDDVRTYASPSRTQKNNRVVFMSETFASTKRNRELNDRWDFGDAPQIHHKKIKSQDNVPPPSSDESDATEKCEYEEWQIGSYLTCNSVHETTDFLDTATFLGQGANNQGWAMSTTSPGATDDFVLKRQRLDNTFSPRYYERARLETLVMQRISSSTKILNTYGYCGTSMMNQKGWREMSSLGLEQTILSPNQMLQYGLGLSQALADLHEGQVLHTDLSSSNVLIGPDMKVILHDFDQAALITHGEHSHLSCGVRMHDEKCDHYRSPEKCNFDDQVLSTKSDVYGLGGLFYFLLSGATPYSFPTVDDLEVVRSKIRNGVLPKYPLQIELSQSKSIEKLKDIVHDCLAFDPAQRPDAREVAKRIEVIIAEHGEEDEESNEALPPGLVLDKTSNHIQSADSSHSFGFDQLGDLSIWRNEEKIWSLGLCCQEDTKSATLAHDGNFVVEGTDGIIYFDAGTDYGGRNIGAILFVDNDGRVKLKNYHREETILFDPYSKFLRRGEMLNQTSTRLNSAESNHTFGFDQLGDLSIWRNEEKIWSLGLCCQEDTKSATLAHDGNFVVEGTDGIIYFDAGTDYGGRNIGAILFVDNDGRVKLKNYHREETILFDPYSKFLRRGEMLNQTSTRLNSAESNHTFGFDQLGDLSIWRNEEKIWSLGLCCEGDGKFATLNSDGNFVVQDENGIIFDTGTYYGGTNAGSIMIMDNDGRVKLRNYLLNETILFDASSNKSSTSQNLGNAPQPLTSSEGIVEVVDPRTMHGKVFTGYQGWFTTPCDDGLKRWHHWSDRAVPDNETLTVDMWPDLDEYDDDELCETNLLNGDGTKASVFSSYNPKTVDRHIRWMQEYGIDGSFVQRFVTDIRVFRHMRDHVLKLVQASSERYGRVFANMYDLTGAEKGFQTLEDIKRDWKLLVDGLKITESPRYLHHNGRPVLGLFFGKPSKSPLSANEALKLIEWLQNNPDERYRVTVIVAGLEKSWRTESSPEWSRVHDKADVISPWTVGRYSDQESVDHHGKRYLIPDVKHCHENNQDYLPVVFPGFSAKNIMTDKPLNEIPRQGGQFLWRQLLHVDRSKSNMVFVAMFDEVDEATAIMKVATSAAQSPSNTEFVTLDSDKEHTNLPSDFYLQLVGEARRLLQKGIEFPESYQAPHGISATS